MKRDESGPNPRAALLNETLVTIALAGVAIYFSALILIGLLRYVRFRRMRGTALITWPGPKPAHFRLLLALGALAAAVAILNITHRFDKVFSQLTIAFYFMFMLPLLTRIPIGFYGEGIWAETGFVPYSRIRRLTFREGPELVLLLLPADGGRAFRLPVPPGEYGAVRRVLGDMIRNRVLNLEGSILGL
jgi:hypothetical protein